MSLVPTMSLRKKSKMTGRYKKTNQTTIYSSYVPIRKGGDHMHRLGARLGCHPPPVADTEPVCAPVTSFQSS